MNMKELASKWGWNLQADKKNIYVAKTHQMYVSLMWSQIVVFAKKSCEEVCQVLEQKGVCSQLNIPDGYKIKRPDNEPGKEMGVCLRIIIPYDNWDSHKEEVKGIAEKLVEVLKGCGIWNECRDVRLECPQVRTSHVSMPSSNDPLGRMNLSFCPMIDQLNVSSVSEVIARYVFNIPKGQSDSFQKFLSNRYEQMRVNFLAVGYADKDKHGNLKWDLDGCHTRLNGCRDARIGVPLERYRLNDDDTICRLGQEENFGHDMPVWLCRNGINTQQSKKVMLITQDPLRNGDPRGEVTLSTPFSLHCKDYRSDTKVLAYTKLVSNLLTKGVVVYATDLMKWYAQKRDFVLRAIPGSLDLAENVLKKEISIVQPDLIVAGGSQAYKCMKGMCGLRNGSSITQIHGNVVGEYTLPDNRGITVKCMAILHSSRSNAKHLKCAGIMDYADYYCGKIVTALNETSCVN